MGFPRGQTPENLEGTDRHREEGREGISPVGAESMASGHQAHNTLGQEHQMPCAPSEDTDVVPGQRGQHRKQDSFPGAPIGDRAADWESRLAVGQPHSPTAARNCPQGH